MKSGGPCVIRIEGICVFAHHGVLPEEKERGQDFLIDITLELERPCDDDSLDSTVDYAWAASEAARIATATSYDLIETLATEIASEMLRSPVVRAAQVSVRKPSAPMPVRVGSVGVTVRQQKPGVPGRVTGDS
jgi:dihydroneopterin aldolase